MKDCRHDERDDAEEEHRRAEARGGAIEALDRMTNASDQRREPEHEQCVPDDRSRQRQQVNRRRAQTALE